MYMYMKTDNLKTAVSEIIAEFDKRYETDTEEVDFLNVYTCADMYISLTDIIFALENGIDFDTFSHWYWFNLENMKINLKTYWRRMDDMSEGSDYKDYHIFLLTEKLDKYEEN